MFNDLLALNPNNDLVDRILKIYRSKSLRHVGCLFRFGKEMNPSCGPVARGMDGTINPSLMKLLHQGINEILSKVFPY